MRRSLGSVLIVLGVICILLAFCLDAAGKQEGGSVSDVSHRTALRASREKIREKRCAVFQFEELKNTK